MVIDGMGVPTTVTVLSGPPQFQAEALRAARQWRFTPARQNGQAVEAAFNLTLQFRLK
jgi:protein TonB